MKHEALRSSVGVLLAVALCSAPAAFADAGLVAYWTFDTGTISGTQVFDSSGNGLTGTLSAATPTPGKVNQALAFSGQGSEITFPFDTNTELLQDLTLATWIKTSNTAQTEAVISRYSAAGSECGYLLGTAPSGHVQLRLGGCNTGSVGITFTDTGELVNDGNWHHVAVTISAVTGVTFFLDGAQSSSFALKVVPAAQSLALLIGQTNYTPYGEPFAGSLDEVRIYNYSLSAQEITALITAPALSVTSLSLDFTAVANASSPAPQTLMIGAGTLSWTASANQPWITITPATGTGAVTASVTVDSSNLTAGDYSGTITVSAPGATPEPQTVAVSVSIASPPVMSFGGTGAQFYVAPTGSPSGNGSMAQPWDLQTALNQPSAVTAGSMIWLLNGVYGNGTTVFSSKLTGTSASPIIVRQYPGARATVNGGLSVVGPYTWYWGFEVTNLNITTRIENDAGSVTDLPLPNGFDVYGEGTKFINLIVHDTAQGIGLWSTAPNSEITGCIIYNNGWQGSDRGHGHGIYTQNETGTKLISDNIIFQGFALGIQAYGSPTAYVENYTFTGNTIFNAGELSNGNNHSYNLLVAGGQRPKNITVRDNYTYHTPTAGTGSSGLDWSFDAYHSVNLIATNNYWIGGDEAIVFANWNRATFTGNVAYSSDVPLVTSNIVPFSYVWDDNSYYGSNIFSSNSQNFTFAEWQSNSGLDAHSTFSPLAPTGTWIFVRPNPYESNRANITIYNWDLDSVVQVDPSSVLTVGQSFELLNAQDYFGTPVLSGVYNGGMLSIPMFGLSVAPATGTVPTQPTATGPQFGAFVLIQE